ncbi:trypsin-like peptidase domain-containing protein [Actinoplanes sp. NPDC048796]|uniref:S1C family serine protease n=1 Tax=Actinoplanes sp. NPDC048796 TaxID=3155640 RepID=UPI0033DEE255
MTTEPGLGPTPRGPHFLSPSLLSAPPPAAPAVVNRRWPLMVAGGFAVLALAAGAGGAAGYVAGRDAPTAAAAVRDALPADLVTAAAQARPGVVSVRVGNGSGSGFAFDGQGHVVTNNHVVAAGGPITVVDADGRRLTATLVGTDPGNDIAVLRVDPPANLPALPLAAPGTTRVGEPVLAVGSPLGLSGTVTAGIISALDRPVRLGDGDNRRTAVQTDASINPGNSGGPLINARGEVIGVNTAIATLEGGGNIGIGFAVPVDRARQVATDLINRG